MPSKSTKTIDPPSKAAAKKAAKKAADKKARNDARKQSISDAASRKLDKKLATCKGGRAKWDRPTNPANA